MPMRLTPPLRKTPQLTSYNSNPPALSSQLTLTRQCSASVATPINLFLLTAFVLLVYLKLRPSPVPKQNQPRKAVVFRDFTPRELKPFNGSSGSPVYLAVKGNVYDVTPGRMFYGPGGPYANFAGRDASRGLASGSFDEEMLTKDLDGPLDELKDLDADQREALEGWEETFSGKYQRVGRLVAAGSGDKTKEM